MKCPKCSYLGFETGDRCKNCGYDFSLIADDNPAPDIDLDIRGPDADIQDVSDWPMRIEAAMPQNAPVPPTSAPPPRPAAKSASESPRPRESRLPLFTSSTVDKRDEPLIKLPVTPRPPLAVRRTPDTPGLRVVSRAVRAAESEPALEFEEGSRGSSAGNRPDTPPQRTVSRAAARRASSIPGDVRPVVRVVAASIDHLLLCGIDLAVIYFTLRIAGLSMDEWAALPPVPLIFFLFLLKLAYFYAFTAVGGQTIGKMALHIRVVTEDHASIDAAVALRRTVIGAVSTAVLGLGFLPAFFDPERRAFHDRVARTRVVALRAI